MSDVREAAARALAELGPDEDWPTNEALGGNLTGTRDDEFRAAMLDQAADVLAAVAADDGLVEVLAEVVYAQMAAELCLTIQPSGPNRAKVPGHWQAEAEERAKPYAAAVRAWLTGQEGT